MEMEEEFRVLLTAAERGRADIISRAVEVIAGMLRLIQCRTFHIYRTKMRSLSLHLGRPFVRPVFRRKVGLPMSCQQTYSPATGLQT